MTENEIRSNFVETAEKYLGYNEDDGSHKKILAIYNGHKPLARSYAVEPDDEWCATYASAMAILCGLTDIMPTECSCSKLIELHKKLGTWHEQDDYVPRPADLVIYDWQDKKPETENKNDPDHIGIVCSVTGNTIKVIEGNYSRSVKYRYLQVNGKYIRGFCTPDFASKATHTVEKEHISAESNDFTIGMRNLRQGCRGEDVRALQTLLRGLGYNGSMGTPDGIFGPRTDGAVRLYQRAKGLSVDGIAGKKTMSSLLGR